MATRKQSKINTDLLDELLAGQDPAKVHSSDGLMGDLKKALAERVLQAEMDVHLNDDDERKAGNHRNGTSKKSVLTDDGKIVLDILETAMVDSIQPSFKNNNADSPV